MKKLSILFIIFFFTTNLFAAKYWSGELSNINTPTLKKLLSDASAAYQNQDYEKACKFIDKALTDKSAPEFSDRNNDSVIGPLVLQLIAEKAYYKTLPSPQRNVNPEVEKIAIKALHDYKKKADGKRWPAYTILYHRLIVYYILKGE